MSFQRDCQFAGLFGGPTHHYTAAELAEFDRQRLVRETCPRCGLRDAGHTGPCRSTCQRCGAVRNGAGKLVSP